MKVSATKRAALPVFTKAPTGIAGFDDITGGGLPQGRPTLICGSAGCGKTLFALEFLVRGATQFNEPGVFITFEERAEDLKKNVSSLGFNLQDLINRKKLNVDYIHVERSEISETGEYDLEALFIRIDYAIKSVGAKRVALDTIEALFSGLSNQAVLRAELRRLFYWLKEKGVTAVITGERGTDTLTRQGLEEYVSDCVILLDHRVTEQVSTRRLRIVKYRGSTHGTNEYPFLIDEKGFSVLPITHTTLDYPVSVQRLSTGIPRLDTMLGGKGFFKGSTVLISGTAGSGKSSCAAHSAEAACRQGMKAMFFSFEESYSQIIRNMRSIGINLQPWVDKGLLKFHTVRSTSAGLEMHLVSIYKQIEEFDPDVVILDPITSFLSAGSSHEANQMVGRLIDLLRSKQITGIFTSLTEASSASEQTEVGISSLIDTWILLRELEANGERNRGLYILKSRGMAHSNQVREFKLTSRGVQLEDVYVGESGIALGTARKVQEAREKAEDSKRRQDTERRKRELEHKRATLMAQMESLRAALDLEETEYQILLQHHQKQQEQMQRDRESRARLRGADTIKDIITNGKNGGSLS
jgi:circadian clock protein KaiC